MYKTHFSKEKMLTLDEALKKRREQRKRAVENAKAKKADPAPRKQKKTPSNRKAISAEQMYILRNLFRPGGISAWSFLSTIRPKENTYLGLNPDSITPSEILQKFAISLDSALNNSTTLDHQTLIRSERKELVLLSAVLVPKNWHLELNRYGLIIRPPVTKSKNEKQPKKPKKLHRWHFSRISIKKEIPDRYL